MTRSVNKVQNDIILNNMQNNRSIACGFVKISKVLVAEFWNSLTEELNAAGPPIKNISEWKKVWIDQKRYVRSKAGANLKNQRETGGGPNQTKCLSANEQCIYDLIGMKESVEGLDDSAKYGLPVPFDGHKKVNEPQTPVEVCTEVPCCSKQVTPPPQDPTINKESSEKNAYSYKRKRTEPQEKLTTAELIAKELTAQENLCSKIDDVGDSIKNHNKEMEIAIKRVYRALDKSNDLRTKKIKILEQHHAVMEQLRFKEVETKIEKNKQLIEIEEMKLKIMEKNN